MREAGLILTPMEKRSEFPICEIDLQSCQVNALRLGRGTRESRRTIVPYVHHDLVRRITPHH